MSKTAEQIAADNANEKARRAQEDADLTPEQRAKRLDDAKARADAVDTDSVPRSEVHTYEDGTQVVGVPPFHPLSPKQRSEANLERVGVPADPVASTVAPMTIPPGMPTSGAAAPTGVNAMTIEQLRELAQRQLDSDAMSGKSPSTPNPTTDSNKPELAGTSGLDLDNTLTLGDTPTPEELAKIAAQIKPTGENVTDEQADAAVVQVLRETKGPIVDEAADAKPAKPAKK